MEISKFTEKMNQVEGSEYPFEEVASVTGGVYEGELLHDNVIENSLAVYSGPGKTGQRISDCNLTLSAAEPWRSIVHVYTDIPVVYISYVSTGDTVEADDINQIQEAIVWTQETLAQEQIRAAAEDNELRRAISRETQRATLSEDTIRQTIDSGRNVWEDKYTKIEIDNKLAGLGAESGWKKTVASYGELTVTYPNPEDGWTVNVKDTDYTYRYDGTKWIPISANAMSIATLEADGLLSKEDKASYDNAVKDSHVHENKIYLDMIGKNQLDAWNLVYQRQHEHLNEKTLDNLTQAMVDNWNTVTNKVDKASGKQLSSNDYTSAEKDKLRSVEPGAQANVQSDWNVTDTASDAYIKNKPQIAPAYVHPETTVVPGSYRQVTVNRQGHVTEGKNPNTLAGYGIKDAVKKAPTWNELMGVS